MQQVPPGWRCWEVLDEMLYRSRVGKVYRVRRGKRTDLGTVPQSLWGPFPPYGLSTASFILHDDCYEDRVPAGEMTYREADRLMAEAMRSQGVSRLRTYLMWSAVRWYSMTTKRGGGQGWYRDVPRLLPSLLLLPFLVLPVFGSRLLMLLLSVGEPCVDWLGDRLSRR